MPHRVERCGGWWDGAEAVTDACRACKGRHGRPGSSDGCMGAAHAPLQRKLRPTSCAARRGRSWSSRCEPVSRGRTTLAACVGGGGRLQLLLPRLPSDRKQGHRFCSPSIARRQLEPAAQCRGGAGCTFTAAAARCREDRPLCLPAAQGPQAGAWRPARGQGHWRRPQQAVQDVRLGAGGKGHALASSTAAAQAGQHAGKGSAAWCRQKTVQHARTRLW